MSDMDKTNIKACTKDRMSMEKVQEFLSYQFEIGYNLAISPM
jgi:hypothetical protein